MATSQSATAAAPKRLLKGRRVVGLTDRVYDVPTGVGAEFVIDDIEVRGDLSGQLRYRGRAVEIIWVDRFVGLEVVHDAPRGPLWKGVKCRVIA